MKDQVNHFRLHFAGQRRVLRWIILTFITALAASAGIAWGKGHRQVDSIITSLANVDLWGALDSISSFLRNAFDSVGFRPQWQAQTWTASHGWIHLGADCLIGIAYFLIGASLMRGYRLRAGAPYARIFWMFGIFFFAGASVHLLDALMFWWPAYRLSTLAKIGTALFSAFAAVQFLPTAPKLAGLRSPVEIQREIVQRRKTELELRQIHAQLEGVIEQRTAELASKNEEMEQFLNTVSHDLKSPLVTCLGLTGMLREDIQSGKTNESIDTINRIERSATRMRQLIEDLLNLSRIGKIRFELVEVDTNSMLRSIKEEYEPRLAKIGAKLEVEPDLPHVYADRHWLTEVFENLITNAMKYGCDNPEPRISVGYVANDKDHEFYVRDNGNGIDPAHHAQILQPFRRLRTDKEGSGMGLAIVVRIIKMHGGRIWIDSKPGAGATFWVSLPRGIHNETNPDAVEGKPALIGDSHDA